MEGPAAHDMTWDAGRQEGSGQMRMSVILAGVAATVGALVLAMANPSPATASGDWALNGTYTATSNGEWAATNDVFHNEKSLRSTWTISTVCSYPTECAGTVTSDFGWTAPIYQTGGEWYVKRVIPNWMPCQTQDGPDADGFQVFRFHGASPDGAQSVPTTTFLVGTDATTGAKGACGRGLPLFITMPFKLVKQG